MKSIHAPSIREAYPGLFRGFNGTTDPLLTHEDIQRQQEFLDTTGQELAAGGFKEDIVSTELGGRVVRALFSKGEDDHTIIIPAEYATGLGLKDDLDAVMRAYAIRELVNPNASLLYLPNNVHGENNLNLSKDERKTLQGTEKTAGDFRPLTDRVMAILDEKGVASDKLTGVGNSQGAAVVASLAARRDIQMHSMATFLPPDVIARDKRQLVKDFTKAGKNPFENNLFTNIEISKLGASASFLSQSNWDVLRFGRSALNKDNRATAGPILAGRHRQMLQKALSNTPELTVVRGWTPNAAISPETANRDLGDKLKSNFGKRVENRRIPGEYADATSANVWPIVASLARRAVYLANNNS